MPQVDLETLFRGGSGRKIVCETLIEPSPDLPAESFQLPAEDEAEWLDRNAALDRKKSTKGISQNQNPAATPITRSSSSKRFKSKPSVIIGLPKRPDSQQLCTRRACRRPSPRFSSSKPVAKPAEPEAEPGSPKVSCIGRVRSKKARDRDRCRRKQASVSSLAGKSEERGRLGFWARFVTALSCHRQVSDGGAVPVSEAAKESKAPAVEIHIPTPEAAAPGLVGLKKFSSGRRPDSWGQVEMDVHVARRERLDCC